MADFSDIKSEPLTQHPDVKQSQNISCFPKIFGFSDEDAEVIFDRNRRFVDCSFRKTDDIKIIDNKLHITCGKQFAVEYSLGTRPTEELLGEVDYKLDWKYYDKPVDIGDREFALSRCMRSQKQAILVNKFQKKAAERAINTTNEISKSLNLTESPRPMTVLILLFDSLSRQHFYRNLPKTLEFLNKKIPNSSFASYDFLINNAHGENTLPNMVPLIYGYNLKYHEKRLEHFSINNKTD